MVVFVLYISMFQLIMLRTCKALRSMRLDHCIARWTMWIDCIKGHMWNGSICFFIE